MNCIKMVEQASDHFEPEPGSFDSLPSHEQSADLSLPLPQIPTSDLLNVQPASAVNQPARSFWDDKKANFVVVKLWEEERGKA
jgi:hypothetical protein